MINNKVKDAIVLVCYIMAVINIAVFFFNKNVEFLAWSGVMYAIGRGIELEQKIARLENRIKNGN